MDFQNKEFYNLNKKSEDLIFNHATERVTYRKEITPEDGFQIIEIKKEYASGKMTKRIVSSWEMTVEQFDYWKKEETDYAHNYFNKDQNETRHDVSIENLLETDLVSSESVEDEYIQEQEGRRLYIEQRKTVSEVLATLTDEQRRRYLKYKVEGKKLDKIATEDGVTIAAVHKSISQAKAKIEKEKLQRKIK